MKDQKSQSEKRSPRPAKQDPATRFGMVAALQIRIVLAAIAAGAVVLVGNDLPQSTSASLIFLIGMLAVLDISQLAFAFGGVSHPARAISFAVLHVVMIGLGFLVVAETDIEVLAALAGVPAACLFFAAVAFSLPFGLPTLPIWSATIGAAVWGAVIAIVFSSGGTFVLPGLDAKASFVGLVLGVGLLVISGVVGFLALSNAGVQADRVGIRRRRQDLLSQYVAPEMAGRLAEVEKVFDGVSERECAVLLVDISHFQRKMETAALSEAGQLVQEFHELVGEVVFKYGGLLRHMEGDSLYAVFGLLDDDGKSTEPAVLCAQTMAEAARLWRSERIERGKSPADIYMGIDFGKCVIIPNANPDRPDFSIVGAPFSAARRMERVARLVAADVAITGHAIQQLKDEGDTVLNPMMDHRGPQKVDDRRGVVDVLTWNMPLTSTVPIENVA